MAASAGAFPLLQASVAAQARTSAYFQDASAFLFLFLSIRRIRFFGQGIRSFWPTRIMFGSFSVSLFASKIFG